MEWKGAAVVTIVTGKTQHPPPTDHHRDPDASASTDCLFSYSRKQFQSVLKASDLQTVNRYGWDENVTPHTLRHTFCSLLAQNGTSVYEIQQFAGHSSVAVTEIYMHLAPETREINF